MRLLSLALLIGCGGPPSSGDPSDSSTSTSTSDTAGTAPAPEIVLPSELDFGEVGLGCTKTVQLQVGSDGTYPLTITEIEVVEDDAGVFDTTAEGSQTIAAGDSVSVPISFTPRDHGSYTARLRIRSDDRDDALASVDLLGASAADPIAQDSFVQATPPKLDLALVVQRGDGEGVVDGLKAVLPDALASLATAGLDFQAGVFDMSTGSGAFLGVPGIASSGDVDPGQQLVDSLGPATGNNETLAFAAINTAFTDPVFSGQNAGFVRSDAKLAVVTWAVTDDDTPTIDPVEIAGLIEALHADPDDSALYTVSGNSGLFGLPCFYGGLFSPISVDAAPRLADAAQLTGGVHINLCQNTVGEAFGELVLQTTGLRSGFELTSDVLDPSTVTVTVDGVSVPQDSTYGFVYQSNPARISFASSAIPVAGAAIEVSYATDPECGP